MLGPPTTGADTGCPTTTKARHGGRALARAPGVGLEPTTYGLTIRRYCQLSYPGRGCQSTKLSSKASTFRLVLAQP